MKENLTPALNVPVVDKFSSPKDIFPSESVIDPLDKVKFPTLEPDEKELTPALNLL